ncbi:MAG: hypothetical protein KA752_09145 [Giesbergeria sp.]|nr:hypothetical protein [Giesbergeria sp.]
MKEELAAQAACALEALFAKKKESVAEAVFPRHRIAPSTGHKPLQGTAVPDWPDY